MKWPLLFGFLCGSAMGCSNSTQPASSNPTTVTANRPILPDGQPATNAPVDRTNTGVNVRDRDSTAKTPIDQNENQADVDITADIRKRVVDTKMSVNAQNVKIITQNGKVTLRGPVSTAGEKRRIEELATAVAGAGNVDSQLEVNNE